MLRGRRQIREFAAISFGRASGSGDVNRRNWYLAGGLASEIPERLAHNGVVLNLDLLASTQNDGDRDFGD